MRDLSTSLKHQEDHGFVRSLATSATIFCNAWGYFAETGEPLPKRNTGKAIYLLFNGILGDRSPRGGNVQTNAVLSALPTHDGPRILYGEGSRLGKARLKREGIVFNQIPYGIKTQ